MEEVAPLPEPFRTAGCKCAECPWATKGRPENFVLPHVPLNPTGVIVIGGGPTRDEVQTDTWLTGFMNRELVTILTEAGAPQARLAVMGSWACQPPELRKVKDEKMATKCCRPLVTQALSTISPDVPVLGMGQWAMATLTGKITGLHKARGFLNYKWHPVKAEVTDAGISEANTSSD